MRFRIFGLLLIQVLFSPLNGQEDLSFHPPLDIPMYLSGNFGEIRTDHFHSGIDIKTQGTTGHPVYSAEEGYVSRIKVQSNGYGKSIYVSHPNGYTTVYGHLDRYREDIAAYVKRMQYSRRSYTVDLYPDKESFKLGKGELIAYSGNTGSSSGPHLHFEVRSSANQHPTNVLSYNFKIGDRTPPRFHSIFIYPMDQKTYINGMPDRFSSRLVSNGGLYTIPYGTRLEASGTVGISVEVFDYLDCSSNRCGIYTLEMFVDDRPFYSHLMDEFSFSETRYINAHIDYEERIRSGTKAHRLHRLPNDRLRIYDRNLENKVLNLEEDRDYNIRIVAMDVAGNSSVLEFSLKGQSKSPDIIQERMTAEIPMKYMESNSFSEGPVDVMIPANALYQDLNFSFKDSPPALGSLTPFYHIGSETVALHLPYTLSIQSPSIDPSLHNKLLFISYNDKKEVVSAGGAFDNGRVTAKMSNFGIYAIALDTIAPRISLQGYRGEDYTGMNEIRFTVRDELSGINKYEGYIDNKWVLFEYDPKNNLLFYRFDEDLIEKGMEHELELYVSDEKGNASLFHTTFTW